MPDDSALYAVKNLPLLGNHRDRKLCADIAGGGIVHLNVLTPGARAGNHYHLKTQEFFINPGPTVLRLHLRARDEETVHLVEMAPASLAAVRAYQPRPGVTHLVENPSAQMATLIIIVDRVDLDDIFSLAVYPAVNSDKE